MADFITVTHYNSPQTKCNSFIVTVGNGISQTGACSLGITVNVQRQVLTRYYYSFPVTVTHKYSNDHVLEGTRHDVTCNSLIVTVSRGIIRTVG